MRKYLFNLATAISLILLLNSCGKDNLDSDTTLKFSKLTVEDQKDKIQENAMNFMKKMDGMKDTKAMQALNSFENQTNGSPAFIKSISVLSKNLAKNDMYALEKFNKQMRVMAVEDDNIWGSWTWNSEIEDFDYVSSTTKSITVLFPAIQNSSANSGELKIDYEETSIRVPDSDPIQYMPKSINVLLKVSAKVVLAANYSGSFNSDATPIKVTQTLEIENYNWKLEFKNDNKDASINYEFKYSNDILMKYEVGAAGTLTATAIEASMDKEDGIKDILSSGAVYLQIMDVALKGGFKDFKGFYTEGNALNNNNDDEVYYNNASDILNKYLSMYAYFVNDNKKIADVEFFAFEDKWNNGYEMMTNYSIQPRLIFGDGSKQTVNEFFTSGFENLFKELESYEDIFNSRR